MDRRISCIQLTQLERRAFCTPPVKLVSGELR